MSTLPRGSFVRNISAVSHNRGIALERACHTIRYCEIRGLMRAVTKALREAGACRGEVVALGDFEPLYWPLIALTAIEEGWVFCPLPVLGGGAVSSHQFDIIQPSWIIVSVGQFSYLEPHLPSVQPAAGFTLSAQGAPAVDFYVLENLSAASPRRRFASSDISYFVTTSGTTGFPRLILGSYRGLAHFVSWQARFLGLESGARFSQLTSSTFDPMYREILTAWHIGGTVVLPWRRSELVEGTKLVNWLRDETIGVLHCVPDFLRTLADGAESTGALPKLKAVFVAGDHLFKKDVVAFRSRVSSQARLINLYGPSETTLAKFAYEVGDVERLDRRVPVGQPIPGASGIVLTSEGKVCSPYQVGEIHIRTGFRSHGYLDDPKGNRDKFISNPFGSEPEDVIFRTGDLGFVREDGNFEIVGRADHRIKVRGRWVDLSEVEAAIVAIPGVHTACAVARQNSGGSTEIVCFYVGIDSLSSETLRMELLRQVPPHAVPAFWVSVQRLPLTAHGKYDREYLRSLSLECMGGRECSPLSSNLDKRLLRIFSEVLGAKGGEEPAADFFALGGQSIEAIRILERIEEELGIAIAVQDFAAAGNVLKLTVEVLTQLAGRIDLVDLRSAAARVHLPAPTAKASVPKWVKDLVTNDRSSADRLWQELRGWAATSGPKTRLEHAPRSRAPLTDAQRRFLALESRRPNNRSLLHHYAAVVNGRINLSALQAALTSLSSRHASLRTGIVTEQDQTVQASQDGLRIVLEVTDRSDVEDFSSAVDLAIAAANRPFSLDQPPLLRTHLFQVADQRYLLLLTGHVIVSDGRSKEIWFREITVAYRAALEGKVDRTHSESLTFLDFAAWRHARRLWDISRHADFWRQTLSKAPWHLPLPYDRLPTSHVNEAGDSIQLDFPEAPTRSLEIQAQNLRVTPNILLLSCFLQALAEWSNLSRILLKIPHPNRPSPALDRVTGCFADSILLSIDIPAKAAFTELVARTAASVFEALEHADLSFEQIADAVGLDETRYCPGLLPVMYSPQFDYGSHLELAGTVVKPLSLNSGTAIFNIHAFVVFRPAAVRISFNYASSVFDRATVEQLVSIFLSIVRNLIGD